MSDDRPPHPWIPDWAGERSWTAPGEPLSSFITFQTEDGIEPFRITHDRDMMFDGGGLVQDYNFICYWFGDPEHPVRARHYFGDAHIGIALPDNVAVQATADGAAKLLPPGVLNYCQRRFAAVTIMTREGYADVWGTAE